MKFSHNMFLYLHLNFTNILICPFQGWMWDKNVWCLILDCVILCLKYSHLLQINLAFYDASHRKILYSTSSESVCLIITGKKTNIKKSKKFLSHMKTEMTVYIDRSWNWATYYFYFYFSMHLRMLNLFEVNGNISNIKWHNL
jgi:hypothetical protein